MSDHGQHASEEDQMLAANSALGKLAGQARSQRYRVFGRFLAVSVGIGALEWVLIIGLLALRHSITINATPSLQLSNQGLLPNQTFTPGAARQVVKAVPLEMRQRVFAEYGIADTVCSHQLDLAVAQAAIATNWIAAYKKYVDATPAKGSDVKASFEGKPRAQ
jgi:hypothetical protein